MSTTSRCSVPKLATAIQSYMIHQLQEAVEKLSSSDKSE